MEKDKRCRDNGSIKKLFLGTGGTLGVMSLLGACGGACSMAAIPLGSMLGAIGLSGLTAFLPYLRWPLLVAAAILSFLVLRSVVRQGKPLRVVSVALVLGAAFLFAGFQAFKPTPCEVQASQGREQLSPEMLATFDSEMAKGCEVGCAFSGKVNTDAVVPQPGATVGDLVRCPVSGVIFKIKPDNPQIMYSGKTFFTCCAGCAARFNKKIKPKA
jgi:hypothetical protein